MLNQHAEGGSLRLEFLVMSVASYTRQLRQAKTAESLRLVQQFLDKAKLDLHVHVQSILRESE